MYMYEAYVFESGLVQRVADRPERRLRLSCAPWPEDAGSASNGATSAVLCAPSWSSGPKWSIGAALRSEPCSLASCASWTMSLFRLFS